MFDAGAKCVSIALAVLVLDSLRLCADGADPGDAAMLERLRAADAAVSSRFTILFEMELPSSFILFDHSRKTELCTITQREGVRAVECETTEYPPVVYRAPGTGSYTELDYDDEGNLIIWRVASRRSLMDATTNETLWEHRGIIVDPGGQVIREMKTAMRSVFRLTDPHDWYEVDRWCLAAGIGFSDRLEKAAEQAADEKGMIRLRGKGSYCASEEGNWELTVDPKREFLVRSAQFTGERSDKPSIVLSSSGAMRFGDVVIPEEGRFEYPTIPERNETVLRFREYSPNGDEKLVARIREELKRAKADDNVGLMDYRDNPDRPTMTRSAPPDRR